MSLLLGLHLSLVWKISVFKQVSCRWLSALGVCLRTVLQRWYRNYPWATEFHRLHVLLWDGVSCSLGWPRTSYSPMLTFCGTGDFVYSRQAFYPVSSPLSSWIPLWISSGLLLKGTLSQVLLQMRSSLQCFPFRDRVSCILGWPPVSYETNDFQLLVTSSQPPKCLNYRRVPPCRVYSVPEATLRVQACPIP